MLPIQGVVVVCVALAAGNLLLGFDLPGAAVIEDLVFSAVTAVFIWLTDADWRMPFAALIAAGTGTAAFYFRKRFAFGWKLWVSLAGLALLSGQVGFVTFGLLMEKSVVISLGAGFVVYLAWPRIFAKHPQDEPRPMGFIAKALVAGFAVATLYYLYAMLDTNPMGYQALEVGNKLSQGRFWQRSFYFLIALSTLILAVSMFRKEKPIRRSIRVLASSGLAVFVLAALNLQSERQVLIASAAVMIVPAFLLCEAIRGWGLGLLPDLSLSPGRTVSRMFLLTAVAGCCMFHAYTFRVFDCRAAQRPAVTQLSHEPEVFRILHDAERNQIWMVQRTESRIVRRDLETEESIAVSFGIMPGFKSHLLKHLPGTPEDLIFNADRSMLYATFNPMPEFAAALGNENPGRYNDIVLAIDPDSAKVVEKIAIPDMCWINCIRWDQAADRLLIGCEDRAEMYSWDPQSKTIDKQVQLDSVGDIQDLEIDRRELPGKLYAISLWYSGKLSELDIETWEVLRQTTIGGTNYEMAFSLATDTLFVSRFYESRVLMVNRRTMEKVGVLPTGLGTRALAVDDSRGLLLVSSIYDGLVRVYDFRNRRLVAAFPVGGHVKSIALDSAGGTAYFSGQCGLLRLDLDSIRMN
jgi:hypothetical protein